jgi:hypothetical protein
MPQAEASEIGDPLATDEKQYPYGIDGPDGGFPDRSPALGSRCAEPLIFLAGSFKIH